MTRSELILEAFDRRQESLGRRVEGLLALRDRGRGEWHRGDRHHGDQIAESATGPRRRPNRTALRVRAKRTASRVLARRG